MIVNQAVVRAGEEMETVIVAAAFTALLDLDIPAIKSSSLLILHVSD